MIASINPISTVLNWSSTDYSFGTIQQNVPVTATYELTNDSDEVLLLQKVKGSCGCTSTDYSQEGIQPGETTVIKATFNAKKIGKFTKTVSVKTNLEEKPTKLSFSGEVIAMK